MSEIGRQHDREAARAEWLSAVHALGEKSPERKPHFVTDSGIEYARLYERHPDFDEFNKLGFPGQYPFTRGIHPTLYRGKLWTMRQYAGFGTAEESNARFRYLLDHGVTGLSIAFDLPTQIGYDSDHPLAHGEVGRVGVAISTLDDMERLLAGIPLERISISMTINATAAILMALLIAVAKRRGIAEDQLAGTVQNDILKEYIARGTYIFPPRPSLRLVTDVISYCRDHVPQWNTISVSGYHIREAGSNAVQELAFTFANAIAYVEAAHHAGLAVDDFAPRMAFFWGCHNHILEEVAKFRAARRIWARIMKERFAAKKPQSMMLRFHTQTAGCTLTAQQPENNAVRVTLQALAAVFGGTQSLHTNARDEALALPSEPSVRLALRTQQIIAYESGVADTIDPLGGSYCIEAITDEIERRVMEYLKRIENMGGAVCAIEQSFFQTEIASEAYRYQQEIERGERIIVGVNRFAEDGANEAGGSVVDPALEVKQKERVSKFKRERNSRAAERALAAVKQAAGKSENLLPPMIEAVLASATLGEIADALRCVWGDYTAPA